MLMYVMTLTMKLPYCIYLGEQNRYMQDQQPINQNNDKNNIKNYESREWGFFYVCFMLRLVDIRLGKRAQVQFFEFCYQSCVATIPAVK